jgi:hypothetical protein
MGQTITVTVRAGSTPAVRLFDLNRSLTGMELERYSTVAEAQSKGMRPPDVLAARLLTEGAFSVTIYSNSVTVEAPAEIWGTFEPRAQYLIEHLFEYYGDDAGWSYEALGLEAPPPVDLAGFTG